MSDYDKGLLRAAEICDKGVDHYLANGFGDDHYVVAVRRELAKEFRAEASQPASQPDSVAVPESNLVDRCKETIEWQKTGILKGDALKNLAETIPNRPYRLQLAEKKTWEEAMLFVLRAAKEPTK
jgi:hypothetical protein